MAKKNSRFDTARKWLIFWTLFIGIGAVAGAAFALSLHGIVKKVFVNEKWPGEEWSSDDWAEEELEN